MTSPDPPPCQGPDPNPRQPRLTVPPGACDCHAHILGPLARYPFVAERGYTPPEALLATYRHMLATLGLSRAVIVQPSVYGTDNSATLAAIAASEGAFRGVAVVGADVTDAELAELHRAGMRGLRINPLYKHAASLADCQRLAERIAPLGWHLQIFLDVSGLSQQEQAMLSRLPVPIVIDHMGYMPVSKGLDDPGFQWLLDQLAEGHAWAKLSGAYYLASTPGPPYRDVAPFAHALIEANPQRCIWASNWPHPMVTGQMPNDGDLMDLLGDWAPYAALRQAILVDNPAALYGFNE
ncbi:MAG: amidohydrolase family protein [Pseudomonadota bacterium]